MLGRTGWLKFHIAHVCCEWTICQMQMSTPVKRCCTPEFVSCENDPALQEQRGEHPKEEAQAQRGKEAFKVNMFQSGI